MPTYALDAEFFEENGIPLNEEEFTRGPQGQLVSRFSGETAQFDAEKLDVNAKIAWNALRNFGITSVYCRYDGGGDEGFAHFETAFKGETTQSPAELEPLFETLPNSAEPQLLGDEHVMWMNCVYLRQNFEAMSRERRARDALDYFAYAVANQLLYEGFGTGVVGSMYGAFRFDFATGEIVDEPTEMPDFSDFEN